LETKKIGVVGSGKMAREHLRALSAHPHTHIAAICSTNMISAIELSKEFDINRFYPSLDVMEFQNVDALVVAISIDSIDD
jgi:predicted dehydrogenase